MGKYHRQNEEYYTAHTKRNLYNDKVETYLNRPNEQVEGTTNKTVPKPFPKTV